MIKNKSLFKRLIIRFLFIIFIIIIVLGISMIYFFEDFYFEKKEQEIINNSKVMIKPISKALTHNNEDISRWLQLTAEINSGQAWLINRSGYVISSYPSLFSEDEKRIDFGFKEVLNGKIITNRIEVSYFERPMLLVGLPVYSGNSEQVKGALLIFTSVAGVNSTIRQVQKMMVYSSLLAIFLASIVAYRWSKSLSEPLRMISKTAMKLGEGQFGEQVNIEDNSEIGTLAANINYLSQKLELTVNDLIEERNKLKYVLTGMEEGVVVIDNEAEIILFNDSLQRLCCLETNKQLLGQDLDDIIKDEDIKKRYLKH
ncbi:sensor histidine kinase [Halanaerobaculum tunisiense]